MDDEFDRLFGDVFDGEDVYQRTCARCGVQTRPRLSEPASLEEARRMGWRRVREEDRPGARQIDLCGACCAEAGLRGPLARWGGW